MSDRLGPVSYKLSDDDPFLGREIHQQRQFSEHTMEVIDEEVAKILHAASQARRSCCRLTAKSSKHCPVARAEEELDEKAIAALIGPRTAAGRIPARARRTVASGMSSV